MKKYILIITTLFSLSVQSQEITLDSFIVDTPTYLRAGSCASPDGATLEIPTPPPNYQYLEDNGYCTYSYPSTSTFTGCYTMTSPGTAINFNAGSSTTCNNRAFSNFRLYNSSCVLIGTGLSFTGLTQGASYTWCLDMRANGGGSCNGFDSFCPYFTNVTVLPITLVDFRVFCDMAYWATGTEKNNDYFLLEGSSNGESWETLSKVSGHGTSSFVRYNQTHIESFSGINYYRLTQVDFDGVRTTSDILTLDCGGDIEYEYYNILGQKVTEDYIGYKFRVVKR